MQVRALRSGNATAIADILRLVETAQARTAPVQRLADAVAGKFAYAVMGVSAATFAFWASIGTRVFPQVQHEHSMSTALAQHEHIMVQANAKLLLVRVVLHMLSHEILILQNCLCHVRDSFATVRPLLGSESSMMCIQCLCDSNNHVARGCL